MMEFAGLVCLGVCVLWLGWWGLPVGILVWLGLSAIFAVAQGLYLGMRGVVRYHGGWRGVWRYVRS